MKFDIQQMKNPETLRAMARERGLIDETGVVRLNRKVLAGLKGGGTYEYGLCISMVYDEEIVVGSGTHQQKYRRAERACKGALAM